MVTLGNQVGINPGKRIQMKIDNIFCIIKSAIISVPSNTWQRSFRTTLHSRQSQFIRFNPGYSGVITVYNSTQRASMDAGVKTPQCPHLSIHFCISSTCHPAPSVSDAITLSHPSILAPVASPKALFLVLCFLSCTLPPSALSSPSFP